MSARIEVKTVARPGYRSWLFWAALGCVLATGHAEDSDRGSLLPEAPHVERVQDQQLTAAAERARVPWMDFSAATLQRQSAPKPPRPWWPNRLGPGASSDESYSGKYQWRGLIWQSVEFDVFENGFRVSSDHVMRDTLAHRPFWHNYGVSMDHFNMRRWNDGDTFIVNYVGHGMHGAIAADLEIQNSPTDRRLEWGDPGYAKSRFKAFLWATVYSTHSEISPAGEPGIGNEGAFTYGKNCLYKCYQWAADNGSAGSKFTNDTGWVDFIATPTVGLVWVTTEDLIDKYLTDRMVAEHPGRLWPRIVRSSLTPSRTFANVLRWKPLWYRDFEQPLIQPSRVHWFPSEEQVRDREVARVQVAPFWSRFSIAANTPGCFNCREAAIGGGVQTTVKLHGWLGLDTSVSYHPGASPLPSDRAGGDMLAAFAGLSVTRQWRYYAVHFAMRPGMVQFNRAYLTSPVLYPVVSWPPRIATHGGDADGMPVAGVIDANGKADEPALGAVHHFVWDWNLALDYRVNRHLGFRVGLEDAVVRYRTDKVDAPGIGEPPYLSWLSKQQFINRGNFTMQVGPVLSF